MISMQSNKFHFLCVCVCLFMTVNFVSCCAQSSFDGRHFMYYIWAHFPRPFKVPLDQGALHYVPWVSGSSQQDVMAGQNATRILPSCLLSTPLNREREVKGNLKNVEHNRRNDWSSRNLTLLPRSHIIIENPLNLKGLGVYSMQQLALCGPKWCSFNWS